MASGTSIWLLMHPIQTISNPILSMPLHGSVSMVVRAKVIRAQHLLWKKAKAMFGFIQPHPALMIGRPFNWWPTVPRWASISLSIPMRLSSESGEFSAANPALEVILHHYPVRQMRPNVAICLNMPIPLGSSKASLSSFSMRVTRPEHGNMACRTVHWPPIRMMLYGSRILASGHGTALHSHRLQSRYRLHPIRMTLL